MNPSIPIFVHGIRAKALAATVGEATAIAQIESDSSADSWQRSSVVEFVKAAIPGADWADLGAGGSDVLHDFQLAARKASILEFLLEHGARMLPANVPTLTQDVGSEANFVGQGAARRLSLGTYSRSVPTLKTVSAARVFTREFFDSMIVDAQRAIALDMTNAIAEVVGRVMFDPANDASDGVTPAALTSAASPIVLAGSNIAAVDVAARAAIAALLARGGSISSTVWIASETAAAALATARNSAGALAFPSMGVDGGELFGLDCGVSGGLTGDSDGAFLVLVDCAQIVISESVPSLSISTSASIELSSTPTANSAVPTAGSQAMVSLFQNNLIGVIASLSIDWTIRRPGCIQLISAIPSVIGA